MEKKKSFICYNDWIYTFESLNDDEAGRLIKHILRYVDGQNIEAPDRITKLIFEPIKHQLQRDSVKYMEKVERYTIIGKMGGRPKKVYSEITNKPNAFSDNPNKAKKPDSDNVNDNVTDNINVRNRESIFSHIQKNDGLFISIENLEKFMLSDEKWIETLSQQHQFTKEITCDWIKKYVIKLKTENEIEKGKKDCFSHCARWINQEKNGKNKFKFGKSGIDPNDTSIFCG